MSRDLLLTSLTTFYASHPHFTQTLVSIINGESQVSLRILDWFVTHYARTNNVVYFIDQNSHTFLDQYPSSGGGAHITKFSLYLEYRKQLQSYTKMFFDPFRRHERITFVVHKEPLQVIESTVGQLNFFRWATENYIIAYIHKHIREIESRMALFSKTPQKTTNKAVGLKREIPNTLMHGPCHVIFN
jgi:hypothetical protein